MKLRAIKPLKYDTRRLMPGDEFEVARSRDARLLLATKRVRKAEAAPAAPPVEPPAPAPAPVLPPVVEPTAPAPEDLSALRAEYETVVGKKPFHGWSAETLREKMAAHQADEQS